MSTPLGIEPLDMRRLLLDGVVENLPVHLDLAPGPAVVEAAALERLAGDLVAVMASGEIRRVVVEAHRDVGRTLSAIASFRGYLGSAVIVEAVLLAGPPTEDAVLAVASSEVMPLVSVGDVDRLLEVRERTGIAVGASVARPSASVLERLWSQDVPIRLAGTTDLIRPRLGLLNALAACATLAEGDGLAVVERALEADKGLVLDRRRFQWADRRFLAPTVRAVRARLLGVAAPGEWSRG